MRAVHLRELFAKDDLRGERLAADGAGLYLDYSKQRVTDETLTLLLDLARACGVRERMDAMFAGEPINTTERRAVLHVALRAPRSARIVVDGEDVVPRVHAVLDPTAAQGSLERVRGPTDSQHRQPRPRRLGPRAGHDDGRAARVRRPAAHAALRVQRGRCGLRGVDARPRSRRDAVHRRVEDVHDA